MLQCIKHEWIYNNLLRNLSKNLFISNRSLKTVFLHVVDVIELFFTLYLYNMQVSFVLDSLASWLDEYSFFLSSANKVLNFIFTQLQNILMVCCFLNSYYWATKLCLYIFSSVTSSLSKFFFQVQWKWTIYTWLHLSWA